jgi:hypothetical protein
MKKFLVLYLSETSAAEMMANATPEQAKAGMEAWMQWSNRAGSAIVDLGMPLGNPTQIAASSSGASKSKVSGYSIVQADSMDAARKVLNGHPHTMMPGNTIDLLEFLPMPGM